MYGSPLRPSKTKSEENVTRESSDLRTREQDSSVRRRFLACIFQLHARHRLHVHILQRSRLPRAHSGQTQPRQNQDPLCPNRRVTGDGKPLLVSRRSAQKLVREYPWLRLLGARGWHSLAGPRSRHWPEACADDDLHGGWQNRSIPAPPARRVKYRMVIFLSRRKSSGHSSQAVDRGVGARRSKMPGS